MTTLTSEEIKQGIVKKLIEINPTVAIYKESNTVPKFPNFYIHLINFTDTETRKNIHRLDCSFDLIYSVVSDISTDLKLQQNLDSMSLTLMQAFNLIELNDCKVRCTDKYCQKSDGVLHFYFTIVVMIKDVVPNTDKPMNVINMSIGV